MRRSGLILASLACGGCFLIEREPRTSNKPEPFAMEAQSSAIVQANVEACTRVFSVGQRLLAANPELPQRLLFRAAGKPEPEIFHQGTTSIVITQGLVERCPGDGELAAILSVELGKMIAEREALIPPESRQPSPRPPIEPIRFPGDGGPSNADPLRLRELASYEEEQRRQVGQPHLPDPMALARKFLHRAGFDPELIDKVRPLLRAAAENVDLEQQMTSPPRVAPFVPPGGA